MFANWRRFGLESKRGQGVRLAGWCLRWLFPLLSFSPAESGGLSGWRAGLARRPVSPRCSSVYGVSSAYRGLIRPGGLARKQVSWASTIRASCHCQQATRGFTVRKGVSACKQGPPNTVCTGRGAGFAAPPGILRRRRVQPGAFSCQSRPAPVKLAVGRVNFQHGKRQFN